MSMSTIDSIRIPRLFIDWAHLFRVKLNPHYADENHATEIVIRAKIDRIKKLFETWGFEIDHPNQYIYPDQVGSAHRALKNGKQIHVRMHRHENGVMLRAHVEWHGVTHPVLHMMYANLDYKLGHRMLKDLWCSKGDTDLDEYDP